MNRHERRRTKAQTHKAQHFIAKGYLRAWCDQEKLEHEDPYVWVFDRDGPPVGSPGKRKAPVNIFKESEMYTITDPNDPGARDLSLEHGLSRIESDFCSVRRDYIEPMRPLGQRQRSILLAFAASSQFRTPGFREHLRTQWQPVLEKGQALERQMQSATPQQKADMAKLGRLNSSSRKSSITLDEVQKIIEKPLQTSLASHVRMTVPLLERMTHLTILCTQKKLGFITSDEPVVWFDPEGFKRPPMLQGPALMYKSIEITMPISPTRMLFLGRLNEDWPQYLDLDANDLDEIMLNDLNRRTCRHARGKIVVSRNEFRRIWAEAGEPPAGQWKPPADDDHVV